MTSGKLSVSTTPIAGKVNIYHGFLYSGGVYITIDFPGAIPGTTSVSGINDKGLIVGTYGAPGGTGEFIHGFLYSGGTFTTVDAPCVDPSGLCETFITGINDSGQIVGYTPFPVEPGLYYAERGFVDNGGSFTTFAAPGTGRFDSTYVTGINDADEII
jgi:hypothetical protein